MTLGDRLYSGGPDDLSCSVGGGTGDAAASEIPAEETTPSECRYDSEYEDDRHHESHGHTTTRHYDRDTPIQALSRAYPRFFVSQVKLTHDGPLTA